MTHSLKNPVLKYNKLLLARGIPVLVSLCWRATEKRRWNKSVWIHHFDLHRKADLHRSAKRAVSNLFEINQKTVKCPRVLTLLWQVHPWALTFFPRVGVWALEGLATLTWDVKDHRLADELETENSETWVSCSDTWEMQAPRASLWLCCLVPKCRLESVLHFVF